MTESKHTPGPWRLEDGKITAICHGERYLLAKTKPYPVFEIGPEQSANAALMVAAPAMYKALVLAWTTLTEWTPENRSSYGLEIAYTDICAALEQAEAVKP